MPGSGRLIFFPNWVPFGITLCLSIFLFGCPVYPITCQRLLVGRHPQFKDSPRKWPKRECYYAGTGQ